MVLSLLKETEVEFSGQRTCALFKKADSRKLSILIAFIADLKLYAIKVSIIEIQLVHCSTGFNLFLNSNLMLTNPENLNTQFEKRGFNLRNKGTVDICIGKGNGNKFTRIKIFHCR